MRFSVIIIFTCLIIAIRGNEEDFQSFKTEVLTKIKTIQDDQTRNKGILENNMESNLNQIQALTTELERKSNELNDLKEAQKTQTELHEKETKDLKSKLKTLDMYAKLFLPETCSELKKTGLNEPVTALINPAGSDKEFEPIQVQCDLPENKTILGHEVQIEVKHCPTLGCFKKALEYDAPIEQIEALISSSISCQQTITIDCTSAPIIDLVSKKDIHS